MKPIHLNLAARPYRDYRPVYAAVVVLSLLTAFLMLQNVETYYRYKHETRNTREEIAKIEAETAAERQRGEAVEQRLKGLDLALLDAQTKFVNAKLAQRAFSWSTLLDELESVLPDDVRLISVNPAFTEAGPVLLTLRFEAKNSEGMISTINQMNSDPQFRDAFPQSETRAPAEEGSGYSFNLTVQYIPPPIPGIEAAEVTQ